jgi:pyruvate,orthophosphate dikinase
MAAQGLIRATGRPRLAWDCRRRFLESFGETVLGCDPAPLAARIADLTTAEAVESDRELDSEAMQQLEWMSRQCWKAAMTAGLKARSSSWRQRHARFTGHGQASGRRPTVACGSLIICMARPLQFRPWYFGNGGAASGAGVAFSSGAAKPMIDLVLDA